MCFDVMFSLQLFSFQLMGLRQACRWFVIGRQLMGLRLASKRSVIQLPAGNSQPKGAGLTDIFPFSQNASFRLGLQPTIHPITCVQIIHRVKPEN